MIFLVTGGAGFIGSNLAEKLSSDGHKVRVLDNLSTGKEGNIERLASVDLIRGDIRDKSAVDKAVSGADFVIHLAALGSVPRSIEDPSTTHDVNVTGTLNVLISARAHNVKRVVYASSSSVYGDTPTLPKREDMFPTPQSPYAVSKLSGEYYCKVFHRVYGLPTVALRYFNVYGRRQDPNSQYAAVVPRFATAVLNGESPVIYGDGEQSRDFTFVDDCNQANIKACFAEGAEGRAYNVGYGGRTTVSELFRKIRKWAGRDDIEPSYSPARKGDVKHSHADIGAARESLSYTPAFDIDAGSELTVKWYMDKAGKARS